MFRSWLQQLQGVDTSTLPDDLKNGLVTSGLDAATVDETNRFIDYIIWELNGGYKDLLLSKVSLASHEGLASIYGHSPLASGRTTGGPTATFTGRRQGLLMRSSYLAYPKSRANLVQRGVRVRRQVLCENLPDPTPDSITQRQTLEPTTDQLALMSTRTYIANITNNSTCLVCHNRINPTGFAFNNFDSFGRFRSNEKIYDSSGNCLRELPSDSASTVPLPGGDNVEIADAYDLVSAIANSTEGPGCFSKQAMRFFIHRKETTEDGCLLSSTYQNLTGSNASILNAFVASLANNAMTMRRK